MADLWLVGAGPMAQDYYKVIRALGRDVTVIGRSENSAKSFREATGTDASTGGLKTFLDRRPAPASAAIVAVNREFLSEVTCQLLDAGVKKILVEKPAGLSKREIEEIQKRS